MEQRNIRLHFFMKLHMDNFAKICDEHSLKYTIDRDEGGYYLTTDPVDIAERRKIILEWAKVCV